MALMCGFRMYICSQAPNLSRTLIVAVVLFDFNMVASGIKVVKQYELSYSG